MNDAAQSANHCTLFRLEESAVDSTNRDRIATALKSAAPTSIPLIIDWTDVVYVDFLGLESLFDCLLERSAPVAFFGANREVEHLFRRLQILAVLPTAKTADEASRLIGDRR